MLKKINKTLAEWKGILPPAVFAITRGNGTEPPFENAYWDNKKPGVYLCSNCGLELFDSEHKFDSGTGWPSFWQPVKAGHVITQTDNSGGMIRTEARCGRCDSHLGHLFDDGPAPTNLRYCTNSAALLFRPK